MPEVPDEQLTPKKKRAMLEYMAILFAVAFLLVAISLLVKLNSVQQDLDAANLGARENIEAMEEQLESVEIEKETLIAQCSENERSAKACELLLLAQNALQKRRSADFRSYMAQLEDYADALPETAVEIYAELERKLS